MRSSNSSAIRCRFPRQSAVRNAPAFLRSSRLRKQVHQTRATRLSHGSCMKVSGSGMPTSSIASGPYPMYSPCRSTNRFAMAPYTSWKPFSAIRSQCFAGTPLPMIRPVTETNW